MSTLTRGHYDIRDLVFAGGYGLTYLLPEPDEILILSLLPPRSSQAPD